MAHSANVNFLIGAGLCVDAGLPHSVALAEKLKKYLEEQSRSDASDDSKIQIALLYFLIGGIRYQWARLGQDPDDAINIEQIATAALRLRHRGSDPLAPYVASWSEKILEFEGNSERVFGWFSELIFARLKEWLATPPRERIEYVNRLADLHDNNVCVSIFSLNYDLVVETAFANAGRKVVNGFSNGRWDPKLFDDPSAVCLYKLHGSLDWIDDEMYGVCSLAFDRHPKAEDFEANALPLLIFGTDAKLSGKDPFLTLVHAFSEHLRVANVLVAVGYGFTDAYINEIVEQRMRDNPALKLIIVSPHAERIRKASPFLDNNPRVLTLESTALAALNNGSVRDAVVRAIREAKQELPF